MASGWQDLKDEHLAGLGQTEFEEFCTALVTYEVLRRHADSARVSPPKKGPDGGRDILVDVRDAPDQNKRDYRLEHNVRPLTEDPNGEKGGTRIAYSCKTGGEWLTLALRDIKNPKRGVRAAEVLEERGYFKLLVNQNVPFDRKYARDDIATGQRVERTAEQHLCAGYAHRLGLAPPEYDSLSERIEIVDAHRLARYLRQLQPAAGDLEYWRGEFGLGAPLDNLDDWQKAHERDREDPPPLIDDQHRIQIRGELSAWLSQGRGEDRCAAIVGSPGVGKTRLVLETLMDDERLASRVRVARSPEDATDAIDSKRILRSQSDLILVVDDCLMQELERVTARFSSSVDNQSRARLLVLVPSAHKQVARELKIDRSWSLEALEPAACRSLIATLLKRESGDGDVAELAKYAEGFPWFARLLAREYEEEGVPPETMREALKWALASRGEALSEELLENLRLRRARTLLAAALAGTKDWTLFEPDEQEALARAVGIERWESVMETAHGCVRRGLLRRERGWKHKYVTPQVLEREIYRWLLGPEGPDPGGRRLRAKLPPALRDALIRRLESFPGLDSLKQEFARQLLAEYSQSSLVELERQGLLRDALYFLAKRSPVAATRALRVAAEASELGALRDQLLPRHRVVRVLEHLATLPECFQDGEAALFRLTLAGVASPANARGSWARCFVLRADVQVGARVDRLAAYLADPDAKVRLLALSGIFALLSTRLDRADSGPEFAEASSERAREARARGWSLLGEGIHDPSPEVRDAARDRAIKLLRSAIRIGVGAEALAVLRDQADAFEDRARVRLLHKLDELEAYEVEHLEPLIEALEGLRAALRPRTYADILHERVGLWGEPSLRDQDAELDDIVAEAGLGEGCPLRGELPWLCSSEAERAHMFAYAIGRKDARAQLFDDLCELARAYPQQWRAQALLARYLGGMHESGNEAALELVAKVRNDPSLASAAALAALEFGIDRSWSGWLESALLAGELEVFAVQELARRAGKLDGLTNEEATHLLGVMAQPGVNASAPALRLLLARFDTDPAMPFELLARLLDQLRGADLSGVTGYDWRRGAARLCEQQPLRAATLALQLLIDGHAESFAWPVLHQAADLDTAGTLDAVLRSLEDPTTGHLLRVSFEFHREVFPWPAKRILAWVGDDDDRAVSAVEAFVRIQGEELPFLARELLHRFGAEGAIASALGSCLMSRGGVVSEIVEHDRRVLARARRWSADEDPLVASFASALCERVERELERHLAVDIEFDRKYGT